MDRISIKDYIYYKRICQYRIYEKLISSIKFKRKSYMEQYSFRKILIIAFKNANEETEWVLNNGNLWYWYLSFFPLMMIFILEWNRQSMLWEFRISFKV